MIGTPPRPTRVSIACRGHRAESDLLALVFQPAKGLDQFADQGGGGDEAHKKNASLEV